MAVHITICGPGVMLEKNTKKTDKKIFINVKALIFAVSEFNTQPGNMRKVQLAHI